MFPSIIIVITISYSQISRSTSANQLCVTEVLTGIQDTIGTLSIDNLISLVPKLLSGSGSLDSTVPKNVTCSSCAKQAYNTLNSAFPNLVTSDDKSAIQSECGASFTGTSCLVPSPTCVS